MTHDKDKVLYTDGRDVTVTDTTLHVKKASYHLDGITRHGLLTLHADRVPGIVLLVLGIALIVLGALGLFPATWNMETENSIILINNLAIWVGAGMTLLGIILIAIVKERYAVRIATAEGEKNAVVSDKREYITQIVDALNKAFNTHVSYEARKTYVTSTKP